MFSLSQGQCPYSQPWWTNCIKCKDYQLLDIIIHHPWQSTSHSSSSCCSWFPYPWTSLSHMKSLTSYRRKMISWDNWRRPNYLSSTNFLNACFHSLSLRSSDPPKGVASFSSWEVHFGSVWLNNFPRRSGAILVFLDSRRTLQKSKFMVFRLYFLFYTEIS